METKTPSWRLLAIVTFLVLLLPGLAICQEAQGVSDDGQRPPLQRVEATQFDYANNHSFPNVLYPYTTPFVPDPRLDNSPRLKDLIVDGKLVLTMDDAIVLALENNLDIAVARYELPKAQTDFLRAKAGGAARGVAGAYQSSATFSDSLGGGLSGGGGGGGGGAGGSLGGGVNSVGSAGCCDPSIYAFYGWTNAITPLNYSRGERRGD